MSISDHLLLLLLPFYVSASSVPASSVSASSVSVPSTASCSDQVVAFSPCLQYISLPPNNRTAVPSSGCCTEFSSAFKNGSAACLCYLIRTPLLLGFPLSSSRILSLSSLCSVSNRSIGNSSLESFCSGSSALPPLQAIIGPGIPNRPHFHPQHPSLEFPPPPPSTSISSPEVTDSDTLPSEVNLSIITPTHIRSAAEKIGTRSIVSFGLVISILVPVSILQIDLPLYNHFVNQFSRIKQRGNK